MSFCFTQAYPYLNINRSLSEILQGKNSEFNNNVLSITCYKLFILKFLVIYYISYCIVLNLVPFFNCEGLCELIG